MSFMTTFSGSPRIYNSTGKNHDVNVIVDPQRGGIVFECWDVD